MADTYRIKHELSEIEAVTRALARALEDLEPLREADEVYEDMFQRVYQVWGELNERGQSLGKDL